MAGEREPPTARRCFQETRPFKKDPTHVGCVMVGELEFQEARTTPKAPRRRRLSHKPKSPPRPSFLGGTLKK